MNRLTSQELAYCQVHTEAHKSSEDSQGSITVPLQPGQREHSSLNTPHTPCMTWNLYEKISYNFGHNINYSYHHYSYLQVGVCLWWRTSGAWSKARTKLQQQLILFKNKTIFTCDLWSGRLPRFPGAFIRDNYLLLCVFFTGVLYAMLFIFTKACVAYINMLHCLCSD